MPQHGFERYTVTDMHTAGEPVRIFTGGVPELRGESLLEKRRDAMDHHDHVRRRLMLEPRGHADMYGVWPTRPHHPGAALAVLFTHNAGYSTMCGHATIALGRWVVDQGIVRATAPVTRFLLECPCGPVAVSVDVDADGRTGNASFESVPAFALDLDRELDVPGYGRTTVDIGYGGAFYAIVRASALGLDLRATRYETLVDAGRRIIRAGRDQVAVRHPDEADLGFLYGTIITDDTAPGDAAAAYNLCVFGGGQVDRSPTGSGVTARMAVDQARGLIEPGAARAFRGLSGGEFRGELVSVENGRVTVGVTGRAYYCGEATLLVEDGDGLREGLSIPETLNDLWGPAQDGS